MRGDFCESCGSHGRAEYLISRVSRIGRHQERRLCETCARDAERILLGDNGLPLTDLLEILAAERSSHMNEQDRTKVCPSCGNTVDDVREAGVVGCSTCYTALRVDIDHMIRKLHGSIGKPV